MGRWIRNGWVTLGAAILGGLGALTAIPAEAAEKIHISYAQLDITLPIESLVQYAADGTVDRHLAFYFQFIDDATEAEIQSILRETHQVSPIALSHAFYDPMGEQMLTYIGQLIQTDSRLNGLYALRSSIVLSALQPEGFTVLDILKRFPSASIRINAPFALKTFRQLRAFIQQTDMVLADLATLATLQAEAEPTVDYTGLADLRQLGPFAVSMQTFTLQDPNRDNRTYSADLYLPEIDPTSTAQIPVIVVSHGLGSSPADFSEMAEHLASYGFAVALPEHIGSNFAKQQALLDGQTNEVFERNEFINRPQDVSFLLDELERLNASTSLQGRLNLTQVGAIGHSFGGYTVLMLAGGTVDFARLRAECLQPTLLNVSLFLQCRALELRSRPEAVKTLSEPVLRDERIQFVMALNPVSSMLGETGIGKIQIPTVIVASEFDPAAPVVPEQTQTFAWLNTPDRYLVLIGGYSHTASLTTLVNKVLLSSVSVEELVEEQRIFRSNSRALLVAFAKTYVAGKDEYRTYLRSSYVNTLNNVANFQLTLVRGLTDEQVEVVLEESTE